MKHMLTKTAQASLVLAVLALSACSGRVTAYREYATLQKGDSFNGVHYVVTEHAVDGPHEMNRDRVQDVDADSDIVVSFKLSKPSKEEPETPDWARVRTLLTRVNDLSQQRDLLNASQALHLSTPALVQETRKKMQGFIDSVTQLVGEFTREAKLSPDETLRILRGDPSKPARPYENMAEWLRRELERLRGEAAEETRGHEKYKVSIIAFLDSQGEASKPIHVDGYDTIPAGSIQTIDRYGLKLTPEEEAKLRSKIKSSEAAASLIREIGLSGSKMKVQLKELLAKELEKFKNLHQTPPDLLASQFLAEARRLLKGIEADNAKPQQLRDAATALDTQLGILETEYPKARDAIKELRRLAAGSSLTPLKIEAAVDSMGNLQSAFVKIVPALESIAPLFTGPVAEALVLELKDKACQAFRTWVQEELPKYKNLMEVLKVLNELFGAGSSLSEVQNGLEGEAGKSIARDMGDLVDGRVELLRTGRVQGDFVTVKVRFLEKGQGEAWDRVSREESFRGRVVLEGLHREISASVIFARATSSGSAADKWKPNVAATVSWHYLIRDPDNTLTESINFLNPGFGFHLASLNQTDETAEIGVGVNVSLFGGLILAGYGYNLSAAKDREYWMFGLDLLEAFNKVRGK